MFGLTIKKSNMKTKTEVLDEFKDYLIIIEDVTKHIGLGLV